MNDRKPDQRIQLDIWTDEQGNISEVDCSPEPLIGPEKQYWLFCQLAVMLAESDEVPHMERRIFGVN